MTVRLSSAALRAILAHAAAANEREVCGLLWGTDDAVAAAQPIANVAAKPARFFELDPGALIAAHRRARGLRRLRIVGHYHSHPLGDATPSATDAAEAQPDGGLWLIAGQGRTLLWRAVAGGMLYDRFDPVAFAVDGA